MAITYNRKEKCGEATFRQNTGDMTMAYVVDLYVWLKPYKTYDEYRFELNPYPICEYKGTWCNTNPETGTIEPLRVEIRQKFGDGEVLDVGYQPEH